MERTELAGRIQQTVVRPDTTLDDIEQLCNDCLEFHFNGAMVSPLWLHEVEPRLKGSGVIVCTALGYPMGGMTGLAKAFEIRDVLSRGAQQIDFMPAIGYLKSRKFDEFRKDVETVVVAAEGVPIKVMLEFGMLTPEEKTIAAELSIEAGVSYVKNSSGWGDGGKATVDDIQLLRSVVKERAKVKASGGIRTWEQALALLDAGADLLGTSAGVAIITGQSGGTEDQY